MNTFRRLSAILAVTASTGGFAAPCADISVSGATIDTCNDNGVDTVQLVLSTSGNATVLITASPPGIHISELDIDTGGTSNVATRLQIDSSIGDVLHIDKVSGNGELWYDSINNDGQFGANTGNPVDFTVDRIVNFDPLGDVIADITVNGSSISGSTAVSVVKFGPKGPSFIGSLSVSAGDITEISVADGMFGTSGNTATVTALESDVGTFFAEAIYANIDIHDGDVDDGGDLGTFRTTVSNFEGSLDIRRLSPAAGLIDIEGDLDADITFDDALDSDNNIFVGDDFTSGSTILLPASGLAGQITINTNDEGGTWDGTVSVDSTNLTGDDYTNTAASLGGGSAGVGPFLLHRESSSPPSTAQSHTTSPVFFVTSFDPESMSFPPDCIETGEVVLRFYGEVNEDSGVGGKSVLIERLDGTWQNEGTNFDAFVNTADDIDRELMIVPESMSGTWFLDSSYEHYYRVSRIDNDKLRCTEVDGQPAVEDFDNGTNDYFYFQTADGCSLMLLSMFDLNEDQDLCEEDAAAWSANPVDLNGDTYANSTDLAGIFTAIDRYNQLVD